MSNRTGRTPRLSAADLRMIWIRYAIYTHNRPGAIAREYDINESYVSQIGRRIDPCQPLPPANRLRKSRLTSTKRISATSSAGSAQGGKRGYANSSAAIADSERS